MKSRPRLSRLAEMIVVASVTATSTRTGVDFVGLYNVVGHRMRGFVILFIVVGHRMKVIMKRPRSLVEASAQCRRPSLRRDIGTLKDKTKISKIKITKPTHEMHVCKIHAHEVHACKRYTPIRDARPIRCIAVKYIPIRRKPVRDARL